jgi:hypothetical protein
LDETERNPKTGNAEPADAKCMPGLANMMAKEQEQMDAEFVTAAEPGIGSDNGPPDSDKPFSRRAGH